MEEMKEKMDKLIVRQEKTNELLEKILNVFLQYDTSYHEEMVKEHPDQRI